MGRSLQFAMVTAIIVLVNSGFALWVSDAIGSKIAKLFTKVNQVLLL